MKPEKKDLTVQDFELNPVWRWNASTDALTPVDSYDPLPEDEPVLFIKCRFDTASGEILDGYLIGLETFHAIGVFLDDCEIVINFQRRASFDNAENKAREIYGERFCFFPIEFQSKLAFEGKEPLAGRIPWPYD